MQRHGPERQCHAHTGHPAVCLPVDFRIRNSAERRETPIRSVSETMNRMVSAEPHSSGHRSDTSVPVMVPAIDWEVAKSQLGDDPATLTEFSSLLKSEAPLRVAEIRHAVETLDAKLLRRAAHTLKGSSAYFGAQPLTQAAQALEKLGQDESFVGVAEMLDTLERELTRVLAALDVGPPGPTS